MGRLSADAPQGFNRELQIGEARHIPIKDRDGSLIETVTLWRTARPYVHDLCDAYNSRNSGNQAVEWMVGADGNLHLQNVQSPHGLKKQLEAKSEQERRDFNHRQQYPVA